MRKTALYSIGILCLAILLNGCTFAAPMLRFVSFATATATITPTAAVPVSSTTAPVDTPTPTAAATPTATFTATPSIIGPTFAPDIDPLTGLPVADISLLNRRPLAIKVSNFPANLRPHSGMSFADLVFHYYTEEGMTRFLALFLGQDAPSAGPLRSARLVDAQLTVLYQAILGFVSADSTIKQEIYARLANRAVSERPITCPGICRGANGDVNSVFADTKALTAYALTHDIPEGHQNLDGMVFDPVIPAGGIDLNILHVEYNFQNRSEWRYDPASGRNLRYIEAWDANGVIEQAGSVKLIPLTDRDTGQPISAANTVVLFAQYEPQPGNESYEVEFWSKKRGRALLFRDGQLFEGTWNVTQIDAPLVFRNAQGNPMPFKPGNTWFEIVGVTSYLKGPTDGLLHIMFEIP